LYLAVKLYTIAKDDNRQLLVARSDQDKGVFEGLLWGNLVTSAAICLLLHA